MNLPARGKENPSRVCATSPRKRFPHSRGSECCRATAQRRPAVANHRRLFRQASRAQPLRDTFGAPIQPILVCNEAISVRLIGPVADVARSGGSVALPNTLRIESRPDLFSPSVLCRSHKQRSKSWLILEIDSPFRKL